MLNVGALSHYTALFYLEYSAFYITKGRRKKGHGTPRIKLRRIPKLILYYKVAWRCAAPNPLGVTL